MHLPTVDFTVPPADEIWRGVEFLRSLIERYGVWPHPLREVDGFYTLSPQTQGDRSDSHMSGFCRLFVVLLCPSFARSDQSVFVHCKAGRGRSTVIVLCYYVAYEGYRCVVLGSVVA